MSAKFLTAAVHSSWCHICTLTVQHVLCVTSQELYERCDKLRRAAFKMATETEDNDTSLGLSHWSWFD